MPQDDDKLLDRIFQKYKEDDSEEDLLKYILETVFHKLLEKEMTEHIKAQKYEQNEERSEHRNGYRERNLYTRVCTLELRGPRDREGNFCTVSAKMSVFCRFQNLYFPAHSRLNDLS